MKRFLLALAAIALLAAPADAGRRCWRYGYSYGYTLSNSYCWPSNCWQCHPRKQQAAAYNWREAITTIEKQKVETSAFLQALQTVSSPMPGVQPQGYVAPQGYGAYGQVAPYGSAGASMVGEYSSYPVQGSTLLGASAFTVPQTVDLNGNSATLLEVAKLQTQGATQIAGDVKDLSANAFAQQQQSQTQAMAFQALAQIAQGRPANVESLRFQIVQGPNGTFQLQPQPQVPQQGPPQAASPPPSQPAPIHPGLAILQSQTCSECHSPGNQQGTFDVTALTVASVQAASQRVSLPDDDPKRMPKAKVEGGFGPGRVLSSEEKRAIQDLALGVQSK